MDGLSFATAIVTFIDTANRIQSTLSKVGENKSRIRRLTDEVIRGLSDLEHLLQLHGQSLDQLRIAELQGALDDLRSDLDVVYNRCRKLLAVGNTGLISVTLRNVKAWLTRSDIEAGIMRLENRVKACYIRFLLHVAVSTQVTASQTEYHLLAHRHDYRNQLERFEEVFSQILCSHAVGELASRCTTPPVAASEDIDVLFLHRQVKRIQQLYDSRRSTWTSFHEKPHGQHIDGDPKPSSSWNLDKRAIFDRALTHACQTIHIFGEELGQLSIQDVALAVFHLADALNAAGLAQEANIFIIISTTLYSDLYEATHSVHFQRYLAASMTWVSYLQGHSGPEALVSSDRAVDVFQKLYDDSGHSHDQDSLLYALHCYSWDLLRCGLFAEAVDYSQQTLMLHRERFRRSSSSSLGYPQAVWRASGESSVVLSSDRQFQRPSCLAYEEAWALWTMACGLSSFGRYAEARVAAFDALNCIHSVIAADGWYRSRSGVLLKSWKHESASWVSMPRYVGESSSTSGEELESSE